jgi:CBS domain-containing protein
MKNKTQPSHCKPNLLPFITTLPIFAELPKETLVHICNQAQRADYKKGHTLSVQNVTDIDRVYIIESGELELFYEKGGEKTLRGNMQRGDIFGGISILMNSGISVRTVVVSRDVSMIVISSELFLDICTRNVEFYTYFVEAFHDRMLGQAYAAMFEGYRVAEMLSATAPFDLLPEPVREKMVGEINEVYYSKGAILFSQEKSKVEYLYIIKKGALERYWDEGGDKKLYGVLKEGDTFGGISMLVNNGTAVRTARVAENTHFYILAKDAFLSLCDGYPFFSDYFTNTFGRRMLDRSYASIIRKDLGPKADSAQLFNMRVEDVFNTRLLTCQGSISIQAAAKKMNRRNNSSIFVKSAQGDLIGIVTDYDIRSKVVAQGYDIQRSVSDIMSSPLNTIPSGAMISEALLEMLETNIKHLAVTDAHNQVVGVITNCDILSAQEQSPFFMLREITTATSLEGVLDQQRRLPRLIHNMISNGAKSMIITKLITSISDAILAKLIRFALDLHGPAPVEFAFMILGSEGRMEQTLKTDQDNAIVYADVDDSDAEKVHNYFLQLGETVCTWLDQAGYAFCNGDIMAKNPRWCQPVSKWKKYFYNWIRISTKEDQMQAAIFFDFRGAYGNMDMVDDLRLHLFKTLEGWSRFFKELTENALGFRPPLGFFKNFVVESKGKHRNEFNIKNAMTPVVDFARIYALDNNIADTNTQDRLYRLHLEKVLNQEVYHDLNQAYDYLMQQRLMCQITSIEKGESPDNYINPKKLSKIEQSLFRTIFKRIEGMQTKLKLKFTGSV